MQVGAGASRGRGAIGRLRELEGGRDDAAQRAEVQRLGDEIEGAELEGAHRRFDVAVRGDHGAGHAGRVRAHPFDQVEAITVRQPHVGEAQVEALRLEQLLGGRDVTRRLGGELHARQGERHQLDEIGFIIDDQDQRWRHVHSHPAFGIPEDEAEQAAAAGTRLIEERGAVGLRQFARQEQAQSRAAFVAGEEGLEDALAMLRRNARTAIGHFQEGARRGGQPADAQLDRILACTSFRT